MKKKLVIMLFAAVIVLGFAKQHSHDAHWAVPHMTSIQPINFVSLSQ